MTSVVTDPSAVPPGIPRPAVAASVPGTATVALGTTVPATASLAIAEVLRGPVRPASVLAVFPTAVYLQVIPPEGTAAGRGAVVALLTSDATRLPLGIVLHRRSTERPLLDPRVAHRAAIGAGGVRVGSLAVRAGQWWDPRPRLPAPAPALVPEGVRELRHVMAAALPEFSLAVPERLGNQLAVLRAALRRDDLTSALRAAQRMLGLGPGLTPAGDDLLCGVMAGLALLGHDRAERFGSGVLALAPGRTTALSLALLRHAKLGQVSTDFAAVIRALAGLAPLQPGLTQLLGTGHTSGSALAFGLSTAVDLTARPARARQ